MLRYDAWQIKKSFAIVFLSLSLITSCDSKQLEPLPQEGTILAFGDSLVAGKGVSRVDSFPTVLARLSNRTVTNAGVSGEITEDGLIRLTGILEETTPDLLILLEGGNDILRNLNLATAKSNISSMIILAKNQNIPVILIGVPEKRIFSNTAAFYQ